VVLCNLGGVIGIALGFALGNLFTFFTAFEAHVPLGWAVFGVVFWAQSRIPTFIVSTLRETRKVIQNLQTILLGDRWTCDRPPRRSVRVVRTSTNAREDRCSSTVQPA